MDDFERELKVGFLDEAAQAVTDVEQCFLALETDPQDSENINKIFRLAHNLKGSSRAVGFTSFGEFTHHFESFILRVKNKELPATPKVVGLLLRANDRVSKMIDELKNNLDASLEYKGLLEEMQNFAEDSVAPAEAVSATPTAEIPTIEIPVTEAPIAAVAAPLPTTSESTKTQGHSEETIRVALSKVETLINFVGEMVILQSVMREQSAAYEMPAVKKTIQQLGKVGKEIQDISMGLRMVPIKPTFQKMQRIVRDIAKAVNKDVAIQLNGEDTELDKTVLEKINDPLVHLIRNSVDHGVEPTDLRLSKGKDPKGRVTLSAYHHAGKLVLEVSDDGGGLNPEKLKKKAIEKKLISPTATLSDAEALNLIFAPGFSTKEVVTDVSGRGVGMDVVKTNIKDLNGEVLIDSKMDRGTTFKIVLPLTLAIIESMVLKYSEEKFVIPLNHVYETLRATPQMVKSGPLGHVLILRNENLPLLRLGDFFGLKNSRPTEDMIAIVIKSGKKPFALLVDDILGQFQVVVKQLGQELQGIKGISGSTILGDGKPALILEPQELLDRKISNNFVPVNSSPKGKPAA